MRAAFLFPWVFAGALGCTGQSTASTSADAGIGGDSSDAGWTCTTVDAQPFDDADACLGPSTMVSGICFQRVGHPPTTGIEPVCAADASDQLFIVLAPTDALLGGDGWTFGPRAAKNLVGDTDTLSAADQTRCATARSAPVCSRDAASDAREE